VSTLRVRLRDGRFLTLPWDAVVVLGDGATVRRGTAPAAPADELLLAADVLDRQIVDLRGRRITRVGDVELAEDGRRLRIAAVEIGPEAILRRLGLRRLARRFRPRLLPWDQLRLLSGRGYRLQLETRPEQAAEAHSLLAERRSHRRRRHALSARKRAPS
jgi:sporulation protein YlmC with PRC-barrel domain